MIEKTAWVLAGIVIGFGIVAAVILIRTWIDECGRNKRNRMIEEFSKRLQESEDDAAEHTRLCLSEQKKQIENTERKAREYQAARFDEERERISKEWYDKGLEDGKEFARKVISDKIKSGDIVLRNKKD